MSTDLATVSNKAELRKVNGFNSKTVYDPRIIDNDNNKALWNSESVELAINGLREGYKLKDSPFLKSVKGANLRKANLPFDYTEEELETIAACAEDKIWFGNTFTKLKDGNKGWVNITLRNYQEDILNQYSNNRWNILMLPRQSGKTTTTVIEIVHFLTFNVDKDAVVIAQSQKVVGEILSKIKECFNSLPFFMQPGFVSFTKNGCVLDNGCRLSIGVASESVVQGFSLDFLFIDEFAYIKKSLVGKFWDNIYPSLVNNTESKVIICSTPNGRNLFHTLWTGAINKTNRFIPYRIYWYDVPGRDEQFKRDTIQNIGIGGWLLGFECSFDVGLKSIFSSQKQKQLREIQTEHQDNWNTNNDLIGKLFGIHMLSKDVFQYNIRNDYFLLSIDLGEGLEQDSTVLKIKKIWWNIKNQRLEYTTVGVFHENDIGLEDFAEMNLKLFRHFDMNKIKVVVENNTYGGEYFANIEIERLQHPNKYKYFSSDIYAVFKRDSKNTFEKGIRWNRFNKKIAVKSFANLVNKDIFHESYSPSIEEYLNFGKVKDSYAAQYGHDDLVMADTTASYFVKGGANIFSTQWLSFVEYECRLIVGDESVEIKIKKQEEIKKEQDRFFHNGFELRNHEEKLKMIEHDALELIDLMI